MQRIRLLSAAVRALRKGIGFGSMRKINSNIKQNICFFLLFTAVYLLWGTAVYYGQYVVEHYQSVSIRMKGGTVSQRELMQMVEQEKENKNQEFAGISAWNQVENQSLES